MDYIIKEIFESQTTFSLKYPSFQLYLYTSSPFLPPYLPKFSWEHFRKPLTNFSNFDIT